MKNTPENLVKKEIKDWLSIQNWFHFPILQGLGAYHGIPDIIAVKNGIVLFIEVKSATGRLSESQQDFFRQIAGHGGHYIIARGYKDIELYIAEVNNGYK